MFKITAIVAAVAIGAAALLGVLYKGALERNGELKALNEANIAKAEEAIAAQAQTISALTDAREQDQALILRISDEVAEARAEADESKRRLDKWRRGLADRTLKKPRVTERAAQIALRRQACEVWRLSGGVGECPK